MGDLQAPSVSTFCLNTVWSSSNPNYIPKELSSSFRAQVITPLDFPSLEDERKDANLHQENGEFTPNGSDDLGVFGITEVKLFAELPLPSIFLEGTGCSGPRMAQVCPYFPPAGLLPQVIRQIRETGCTVLLVALLW